MDWKGGGQANYIRELGAQWGCRWQQAMQGGFQPADLAKYGGLGIQYVVVQAPNRLSPEPAFQNQIYVAYRVP